MEPTTFGLSCQLRAVTVPNSRRRPFLFLISLKIFQPKISPLSHFPFFVFHFSSLRICWWWWWCYGLQMGFAWGLWLRLGLVWRRLEGNGSHGRWIVVGWVLIPGSFRSWMALGRGSWRLILVGLGLNRCWLGLNPWWVLLWCGFCFGVGFASICCWLGLNWWWVLLWCGFCFDWVLAGFCFSDGFCFDYFDGFCFGVGSGG